MQHILPLRRSTPRKRTHPPRADLSILTTAVLLAALTACGGGDDQQGTSSPTAAPPPPAETGSGSGGAAPPAALEQTPVIFDGVGGGPSGIRCSAALGAVAVPAVRQTRACKLAELAYGGAEIDVTFNTDYRATGADYVGGSAVHTGIDFQAHPKPSNAPIYALAAGKVVGRISEYGAIIVQSKIGGREVQIEYLHLKSVTTASTVAAGELLGYEGATSPKPVGSHLHVGMRDPAMPPSQVLGTSPSATTWAYALDPLDFAEQIYADRAQVAKPPGACKLREAGGSRQAGSQVRTYSFNWTTSQDAVSYRIYLWTFANQQAFKEDEHPSTTGRIALDGIHAPQTTASFQFSPDPTRWHYFYVVAVGQDGTEKFCSSYYATHA